MLRIESLPARFKQVDLPSGTYAACGIQVRLQRKQMQFLVQVYLPSFMFVVTSWVREAVKIKICFTGQCRKKVDFSNL